MEVKVITWNLFHGRDGPPDPALYTLRSRLLGLTERNATHIQVNRDLFPEFAAVLSGSDWDVALLQECPPRWVDRLASACSAQAHAVLTSRNSLGSLRAALARANPDLVGAHEGGSNTILARPGTGADLRIAERRELTLPDGRQERRTMAFARLAGGLCVANLHAANDAPQIAEPQVEVAAEAALEWAAGAPLVFGGDLNLGPARSMIFRRLSELGFGGRLTGPLAIDHLVVAGLDLVEPPSPWPAQRRELSVQGRRLRLSDHAPVEAVFATRTVEAGAAG